METKERKVKTSHQRRPRKRPQADVVYTQPKPFNRNRFLLRLGTVVAVVIALMFGMSIFFKVEKVTVAGMEKYDAWTIRQASGIVDGENLLTVSEARIGGNIMEKLPYVSSVKVSISLPDTVHIQITEEQVFYAVESDEKTWWLIDSSGKLLEECTESAARQYTRVLGVKLTGPAAGAAATAQEQEPETLDGGETVPVTVFGAEQLGCALQVLKGLEKYGLIGTVASVDVTDISAVEMWQDTRFQIQLGDVNGLDRKLDALKQALEKMNTYQAGALDVSFTLRPEEVVYTPFAE